MTSTQLSFSAFAAQTPDTEDFAVSDHPALRGCFLPSCPNPLPRFEVIRHDVTGSPSFSLLRNDFLCSARNESLDAPDYLPMGGFDSMAFSVGTPYFNITAFSQVLRG
jgi:hypothetical protein